MDLRLPEIDSNFLVHYRASLIGGARKPGHVSNQNEKSVNSFNWPVNRYGSRQMYEFLEQYSCFNLLKFSTLR